MAKLYETAQEAAERSTFSVVLDESSYLFLCDSRSRQVCAFHGWLVHVSHHMFFRNLLSIVSPRTSWELVSNLDFDYSIITGKRKFVWTYPVGSGHPARANDLTPQGTGLHGVSFVYLVHRHITVRVH